MKRCIKSDKQIPLTGNTVKLVSIIDTVRMIDKFNLDYYYDYDEDVYCITEDDFNKVRSQIQNKDYWDNLKVENHYGFYTHEYPTIS